MLSGIGKAIGGGGGTLGKTSMTPAVGPVTGKPSPASKPLMGGPESRKKPRAMANPRIIQRGR